MKDRAEDKRGITKHMIHKLPQHPKVINLNLKLAPTVERWLIKAGSFIFHRDFFHQIEPGIKLGTNTAFTPSSSWNEGSTGI